MKAFPLHEDSTNAKDMTQQGMDLRDYFAAKAMQALITCAENHGDIPHMHASVDAYRYADAMMEARLK